jgi:cyanophycinase
VEAFMTGFLALEGGAEFGGQMAEVDRRALDLAGGSQAPVRIIPTAAAPDNNHLCAGQNGVRWFQQLGATDVVALPLIDRASAQDAALAAELTSARLIYLLGGFPRYLAETLAGTRCWEAIVEAHTLGAVVAGSSAGAMVLCEHYFDPDRREIRPGLGLLPHCCVLPHHNTFGRGWAPQLTAALSGVTLVGIDEQTGLIDEHEADGSRAWRVYGRGAVTVYVGGATRVFPSGAVVVSPADF